MYQTKPGKSDSSVFGLIYTCGELYWGKKNYQIYSISESRLLAYNEEVR